MKISRGTSEKIKSKIRQLERAQLKIEQKIEKFKSKKLKIT